MKKCIHISIYRCIDVWKYKRIKGMDCVENTEFIAEGEGYLLTIDEMM